MGGRLLTLPEALSRLLPNQPLSGALGLLGAGLWLALAPGRWGLALGGALALCGLCLILWRLRGLPSQMRALAAGQVLSATVLPPPAGIAPARRRHLDWQTSDGRRGRSRRIARGWRWLPHSGQSVTLLVDPATGRCWWEGDLRVSPVGPAPHPLAPRMPLRRALNTGWAVLALAGLALALACLALPLALAGWLAAGGALLIVVATLQALADVRAANRAARYGARVPARVLAHNQRKNRPRPGSPLRSMTWLSRLGHRGSTLPTPPARLVPIGATLTLVIDPVTFTGWWDGDFAPRPPDLGPHSAETNSGNAIDTGGEVDQAF